MGFEWTKNEGELKSFTKDAIAFLNTASALIKVPIILWQANGDETAVLWKSEELPAHPCESDIPFRRLLEASCLPDRPCTFFEDEYVFYGLFNMGDYYIAVGPAVRNRVTDQFEARYAHTHDLSAKNSLPKIGIGEVSRFIIMLFCHFTGKAVPLDEVAVQGIGAAAVNWEAEGDLEHYQLAQSENNRSHRSGTQFEDQLIEAVRKGEVEAVKELMGGVMPDIGEIAEITDEKQKELEYLCVSLLTLLTRAAVEGGMRSETAHELGDIYLKRLADASAKGEPFVMLGLRAMVEFAENVRQCREDKRRQSHIEACKAFVESNLRKNITVAEIAPAIGISRGYLSHIFRQSEGITIQQYIQREKCRHAERLLKYSDYPISLISEYFGFSSQSYFGVCFRNWYGVTPGDYRRVNSKKEST